MAAFRVRRAFTLLEIVLIVASIGIVTALLYPIIGNAREETRQAICMGNQRQLATALTQYAQDNNGLFPETEGNIDEGTRWHNVVKEQLNTNAFFTCPSSLLGGGTAHPCYGLNGYLNGVEISSFASPACVILTADAHANFLLSYDDVDVRRHNGRYIVSFADGHAQALSPADGGIIWGESEEGQYFAYGASSIPVVFKENSSAHFFAKTTGDASTKTVDDGTCVQLINQSTSRDILFPHITISGALAPAMHGLAAAVGNIRLDPGKSTVFPLNCCQDPSTYQDVDTTYQFGEGQQAVVITVRKPTAPSTP